VVAYAPGFSSKGVSTFAVGRFEQMIPLIRHHSHLLFPDVEAPELEILVDQIIANAFDIFTRLAERGLGDLAYPKPLVMAALAQIRHAGAGC